MPREFIQELRGDKRKEAIDVYDPEGLLGHVCFHPDVACCRGCSVGYGLAACAAAERAVAAIHLCLLELPELHRSVRLAPGGFQETETVAENRTHRTNLECHLN